MGGTRTCEICGDVVTKVERATKCTHLVHLCEVCKKQCPGAREYCVRCEDNGSAYVRGNS